MWVWRGLPHGHGRKQEILLCFPKVKAQQEKIAINCMQLKKKKKVKSSQVNILILDLYLLKLSKYKQTKKKN